jgi:cullin-associated NEDD8-dissociated protein 1
MILYVFLQFNPFHDVYFLQKNYAGDDDDDEDEEMADPDEDDDEEELDEYVLCPNFSVLNFTHIYQRYSDDEDTSYKIRRSATKLLSAVIGTRPDRLTRTYKDISPVLISRFGDREETVRLEIWATYVVLLNQTTLYGGLPDSKDDASPRGKRKRDTEETMDVEETPYTLLKAQVPALSKALLNQLKSSKTPPAVLQAGFGLLHAMLTVLPGSLSTQAPLIVSTSKSVLSQAPSTSTSTLHLTCLSFLAVFFATHSPLSFSASLPGFTPVLLKSLGERHPRIASETFRVFSALLNALKPLKANDWTVALYDQALTKLSTNDTDAEVRGYAEDCMADIWICATDVALAKDRKEWEYICRTTGKTESPVKVITKVAKEVQVGDDWVNGCVSWLMGLLTKTARMGKVEVFGALNVLLKRYICLGFFLQTSLINHILQL